MTKESGDNVLVVGGTSGIGLAVASRLAAEGHRVTVTGRDPDRVAAALGLLGKHARAAAVDAADAVAVQQFVETLDTIGHLVLAASGGAGAGPFRELDLTALRSGFDGKLWPQLTSLSATLPKMRADGSITLITAVSARSADPGTAGLAAINGALEAMVPTLAAELGPLRVNAVSPGVIDTPWWRSLPDDQRQATFNDYTARSPVRRVGRPEDVADAAAFLIRNTFTTGVVLPCDGGLHLV